jgi:hypothetical protein
VSAARGWWQGRHDAQRRVAVLATRPGAEATYCAALAAAAASLAVLVAPSGGDVAAHLYRTSLVRHGFVVWDNRWFGGQYPLASYSLLYYPLAAVVGNAAMGIGGVVASAAIFASLLEREWARAGRWPARIFALLIAGQAFTAAYPYDAGVAAMLAALWALQRGWLWLGCLCTLLTVGFSPLAFLFLMLAAGAIFLRRCRINRRAVVAAGALAVAAGLQLGVLLVLPSPEGAYPYGTWRLVAGLLVVTPGIVLSFRGRAGWRLASLFAIWAAASVIAYLVPTPVGHNIVRVSVFLVPLMLVAAGLADYRPRWLAFAAVAGALATNVAPYIPMIPQRSVSVDARSGYWQPLIRYLRRHLAVGDRVEVVPTVNHWEAYYLPTAGIPIARGWYRQLDIAQNPQLYAPRLTAASYATWLRAYAVQFVVVPHLPLEAIDALREARIVESSRALVRRVYSDGAFAVFRVLHPTALITGPAGARISSFTGDMITGRTTRAGAYLLHVHYNEYWTVRRGQLCLIPDGRLTRMRVVRGGVFVLHAIESPLAVLSRIVDADRSRVCGAGD